jgi:hypothetical protein
VALVLGILLQGALILADCRYTPAEAAVQFSKAYHRLDPAMSRLLCQKFAPGDSGDAVGSYLQKVSTEAKERGLSLNYMKFMLYNIETRTRIIDDNTAEVKLTAKKRTAINPIYALIGRFFFIGKTYPVEERIALVKEDGRWKVCGSAFSLSI